MREAATIYRFNWWQRFLQIELPFATIGLVWNSMMSVAGAWFFLMACEQFGDFRLPGLGSYLQAAADSGDTRSIVFGIVTMVAVIVAIDQFVWRPVIAWAEKFKMEQVESASVPTSWVLDFLRRSRGIALFRKRAVRPLREQMIHYFAPQPHVRAESAGENKTVLWLWRIVGVLVLGAIAYSVARVVMILTGLHGSEFRQIGIGLAATFLRVNLTLVLGALWTIPVGVAIGFNPRLARIAQPLAQIAASVPATAVFPVVLLVLIRLGGGLGVGSIVLLLLGTQWYILFNVIAGAIAIPTDLKEAANVFGIRGWERWRTLILPGIFPFLVTGMITASGGAWNASIVAEYFHFKGQVYSTIGIGAMISAATDAKNFNLLLASTIALAAVVVTTNRLLWRRLYRLAETRFKLES
jgi:NitT/TauT family transport system permease protein